MKRVISVLLVLVMIICLFSGCEVKTKKAKTKIGLAAPAATHGWVAGVAYYAEKYCKENGIDYNLTVSENAEEMEKNLDALVEWGAEAVVVWPQWSGMEDAVKEISAKGIPVVSFDVDIDCGDVYKVTGNNYEIGYECADYIVKKLGNSAKLMILSVPSSGSVSQLRYQGFMDYLNECKYDMRLVGETTVSEFSSEAGYEEMNYVLNEYEKIDAVFAMDDELAIGAVKAITESGRTDIRAITGGGGMQEYFRMIADEKYAGLGLASALYSPSMIEDAISSAIDLSSGKSSSKLIVIPTAIVNADNVNDYIDSENTVY